jgi:ATP-dependent Clp protease ATP-binding subunit ClpC
MFNRFSEKAMAVIQEAIQASKELGHRYIGTEHLLMGILSVSESISTRFFEQSLITRESVKHRIIERMGSGRASEEIEGYTPMAKRCFEVSFAEVRRYKSQVVEPEYILMALLKEKESMANKVLVDFGIDTQAMLEQLIRSLLPKISIIRVEVPKEKAKSSEGNPLPQEPISYLEKYGRNVSALAKSGILDPVIGREEEIMRLIQILARRNKNNPCLIGESGVGKTAIVEGLAQRMATGDIPNVLKRKTIISIDLGLIVAGAKYRGEFEERMTRLLDEIKLQGDAILFIDELHMILGAGGAEGALSAGNLLKPVLAKGEIQMIGATTIEEYKKFIERDSALERRFQPLLIEEATEEQTLTILRGLKSLYEKHHEVILTDEALQVAVSLSKRYIADRRLPDKAIDLLDETAARERIKGLTIPSEVIQVEKTLENLQVQKKNAVELQDYELAGELKTQEKKLKGTLKKVHDSWKKKCGKGIFVCKEHVMETVSEWTKIPLHQITDDESEKLLQLEVLLAKHVVGQEAAIATLSRALRRARVGLKHPNRPIGSFMFLGPTGVGKTELSKRLAEVVFTHANDLIRLDMSEYMERHAISKLIGSPPGYVGYDEGGQLTDKVRRRPYSLLLFDEIEKAHPDFFNILLQILDEGALTDSRGRKVDFKNTIIIMTSNVGINELRKIKIVGFQHQKSDDALEAMRDKLSLELKKTFNPEFLNRIDDIIYFQPLSKESLFDILDILIQDLNHRLEALDIQLKLSTTVKEALIRRGYSDEYGARPLKRLLAKEVEDALSEAILKGDVKQGMRLEGVSVKGQIEFRKTREIRSLKNG